MLAFAFLAAIIMRPQGDSLAADPRLARHIALHEAIISLADLGKEIGRQTGVTLYVKHRVADRKVTIVFRDRPAQEAMHRLADCMLMDWTKSGDSYELDLTSKAAAAEARTEAEERERERAGLRDATREIRRLWNLSPQGRIDEMLRLDKEFGDGLKREESAQSPHMHFLNSEISAIHSAGFVEVVGAALAAAKLDSDGVPLGTTWFASGDPNDHVGRIDVKAYPVSRQSRDGGFTDAIGVVTYENQTHGLETKLFATSLNDGGTVRTSVGGWSIPMSESADPSDLDRLMAEWSHPIPREILTRKVEDSKPAPSGSEFSSGMFGRAQLLVDLADRSGVPVVAGAFRRSLTKPIWLAGTTVQECLDSYSKINKAPYRGRADSISEKGGWLMFRADHWWWNLSSEIPESILGPMEREAADHSPLPLSDYLKFLAGLNADQITALRRPESVLLRFPVGSLGSSSYSLTLFGLLDPVSRAQALSQDGIDLSTAGPEAQALAYEALLTIATSGTEELPFIRTVIRGGPGILKGFRFFAEDQIGKARDVELIGNGKEINLSFSYGPTYRNSPHSEGFSCAKDRP